MPLPVDGATGPAKAQPDETESGGPESLEALVRPDPGGRLRIRTDLDVVESYEVLAKIDKTVRQVQQLA